MGKDRLIMTRLHSPNFGRRGVMLIEALFYTATVAIVLNLGTRYLFQTYDLYRNQEKCLSQIAEVTIAGETIKKDIAESQNMEPSYGNFSTDKNQLVLKKTSEIIVYQLEDDNLWRLSLTRNREKRRLLLRRVETFEFNENREGKISFIIVDFELKKNVKKGQLKPLFTFKAVLGETDDGNS